MASITIRDIDERLKTRLRVRAAHHGRSMEEEARDILRSALSTARTPEADLWWIPFARVLNRWEAWSWKLRLARPSVSR